MVLISWFDMDDTYDLERVTLDRNHLCVNREDMQLELPTSIIERVLSFMQIPDFGMCERAARS